MKAAIGSIMLVLGLLVMCVGFFERRRPGRGAIILMGLASVLIGANILVGVYTSRFSVHMLILSGVYLVGILATTSRESLRNAKVAAALSTATIIGIWAIYFLPTDMSSLRLPLLVVVGVLGLSFSMVILVKAAHMVTRLPK
jgi:hypothetical membrane protein